MSNSVAHTLPQDYPATVEADTQKPVLTLVPEEPTLGGIRIHKEIHPGVFRRFIAIFAALMATLTLTFINDAITLFIIGVCVVYGLMFFGTPLVLKHVSGTKSKDTDFAQFLSEYVDTNTGLVTGNTAMVQICLIPFALMVCTALICFSIFLAR